MATILIVEDNMDIQDVETMYLEMEDHDIYTAENGKIGVEKALELKPDLIIMDMHMPVMGGHEAVRILRFDHLYTGLIIAVTASVLRTNVINALEVGCDGFIPKPIGEDFPDLITKFLDGTHDIK